MKRLLFIFLCVISLSGCGLFSKKSVSPARVIGPDGLAAQIIDRDRLKAGGKLLLIPFSAGSGITASEELDRTSLTFVKGVLSTLQEESSPFQPLTASDASQAEVVLKGHIIEKSKSAKVKSWIGRSRKTLAIEGKLVDKKSDRVILELKHRKTSRRKDETYNDLAAAIGVDIGKFLATGNTDGIAGTEK